ncbi:MAG: hypothetical protein KDA58_03065 [Planctomycetaceae bacterium]|nr:hypothetical protein [Planctomycetaceae bacterium]
MTTPDSALLTLGLADPWITVCERAPYWSNRLARLRRDGSARIAWSPWTELAAAASSSAILLVPEEDSHWATLREWLPRMTAPPPMLLLGKCSFAIEAALRELGVAVVLFPPVAVCQLHTELQRLVRQEPMV